ncbi:MAG: hypothetical protein F6K58_09450 [Symploca sp. SIO2E9]|nr:hypothetical protein [Symploca sp. SIO2E9]
MLVPKKLTHWSAILALLGLTAGCFPREQPQIRSPSLAIPGFANQSQSAQPENDSDKVAREKLFPNDVGWIDVKRDFGAKGDGITDDTEAILQAIKAPYKDYTRPKVMYFPKGTYLISDTLQLTGGRYTCCVTFQGQGKDTTIIKLKNNAPGFGNPDNPKAVIQTRKGNEAFRHYFRGLTVHTGSSNLGAIGIDYVSNNRGSIKDVAIKSGDGEGKVGLAMTREWPGPSLIKNVDIEGFDYGIQIRHPEYGLTLEHITLRNQKVAGILNQQNTIAIRGLKSNNSVPVIQNRQGGLVIVLDGDFRGGSSSVSAIDSKAYLYARNITASGYRSAIKHKGNVVQGSSHAEYISHQVYSLFDSPKHSLQLPIEETPSFHENELNNWANVRDYPSIQAAMDSGKSTIYFPRGNYKVSGIINVPATVRKIVGFESFINLNKDLKAIFQIQEDSEHPLIIEGLLFSSVIVEHMSSRSLAIKHCAGPKIHNSQGVGKLFLEDVQINLYLDYPQDVWARQLNSEVIRKVTNKGGNLWILGIKTEKKGTVIETTSGGRTELLGTLIYPFQKFNEEDKKEAAFINNESNQSLIYSVSAYGANRNYRIQVKEIRNGETKLFFTKDMPSRAMPLFVGYEAVHRDKN